MKSRYMRMFKKQKGFTLIELLAVILILGIIALIAIPSVNSVIEQSKKGAIEQTVITIGKAAEDKCTISLERDNQHYVIADGKVSPDLPIKNLPDSGEVTVDKACGVKAVACDSSYCAHFDNSTDKVKIVKNKGGNSQIATFIEDTKPNCFIFDKGTRTITGYHFDDASCPMKIKIPDKIDNTPVEYIGDEAFTQIDDYDYKLVYVRNYPDPSTVNIEGVSSVYDAYFGDSPNDDYIDLSIKDSYDQYYYNYYKVKDSTKFGKQCTKMVNNSRIDQDFPITFNHVIGDGWDFCNVSLGYNENGNYISNASKVNLHGNIEAVDFSEASYLKRIGVSAFEGNKISIVTFDDNKNLEEIAAYAFANNFISKVDLSKTTTKTIGEMSFSNNQINDVKYPNTLINFYRYAFRNNNVENVYFPNTVSVYYDQFEGNPIDNLIFPENTKYVIAWGWDYYNKINNLVLSDKTEVITSGSFSNSNIKKIVIPKSVRYIGYQAFGYCHNLEEIEYYASADLTNYLFANADKLKKLIIGNGSKIIGEGAFYAIGRDSSIIDELIIPDSVEYIGNDAFYSSSIKKIVVGNGVKEIGRNAFAYSGANDIILGNHIESIGQYAFNDYRVTEVGKELNFPTTIRNISLGAFAGRAFEKVTIPSTVENVSSTAFVNPNQFLKDYKYTITVDKMEGSLFGDDYGFGNPNVTVVYTGNDADYKRNGNKFANGAAVYFNPVTGKKCSRSETVSTTGTLTGCMKWYTFLDDGGANLNLLLDHNLATTDIAWNAGGTNESGPSADFLNSLKSLTSGWTGVSSRTDKYTVNNGIANYTIDYTGYRARLLTTREVLDIMKLYDYDVDHDDTVYYINNSTIYSGADVEERGWLYDNLYNTTAKTAITNKKIKGYWLGTAVGSTTDRAWAVYNTRELKRWGPYDNTTFGLRPVITIPRSLIK